MNILKFITPTFVDTALDAAIRTGDAIKFTEEEQAEWRLKMIEATTPPNLARRFIAVVSTSLWAIYTLIVIYLLLTPSSPLRPEQLANMLSIGSTTIMPVQVVVVGFYFAKRLGIAKTHTPVVMPRQPEATTSASRPTPPAPPRPAPAAPPVPTGAMSPDEIMELIDAD